MGCLSLLKGWRPLLWLCLVLFLAGPAGAVCAVDPDVSLAITKLDWEFNPKTGNFRLEAEVMNVSDRDVVDPGIVMVLVDSTGKEFYSNVGRSGVKRIRPEERAFVRLALKVAKVPGTVKVLPFQGIAGT